MSTEKLLLYLLSFIILFNLIHCNPRGNIPHVSSGSRFVDSRCGGPYRLSGNEGTIKDEVSQAKDGNNSCGWLIKGHRDKIVSVTLKYLKFSGESHQKEELCFHNYINNVKERICTKKKGIVMYGLFGRFMEFTMLYKGHLKFVLSYQVLDIPDPCQKKVILTGNVGTLSSNDYLYNLTLRERDRKHLKCKWVIKGKKGQIVHLRLNQGTKLIKGQCQYNNIRLEEESPKRIMHICNETVYTNFYSAEHEITVTFSLLDTAKGSKIDMNYRIFEKNYFNGSWCGGPYLLRPVSTLSFNLSVENSRNKMECEWQVIKDRNYSYFSFWVSDTVDTTKMITKEKKIVEAPFCLDFSLGQGEAETQCYGKYRSHYFGSYAGNVTIRFSNKFHLFGNITIRINYGMDGGDRCHVRKYLTKESGNVVGKDSQFEEKRKNKCGNVKLKGVFSYQWEVIGRSGKIVHLTINKPKLQDMDSGYLKHGHLKVFRGFGVWQGSNLNEVKEFYSSGESITVRYIYASAYEDSPVFNFSYSLVSNKKIFKSSWCGGPFHVYGKTGYIEHFLNKGHGACIWKIYGGQKGTIIRLDMEKENFNFPNFWKEVKFEVIEADELMPSYRYSFPTVIRFNPNNEVFYRGYNTNLFIIFKGIYKVNYRKPYKFRKLDGDVGFNLTYSVVDFPPDPCEKYVGVDEENGTITLKEFEIDLKRKNITSLKCEWRINGVKGKIVHLQIDHKSTLKKICEMGYLLLRDWPYDRNIYICEGNFMSHYYSVGQGLSVILNLYHNATGAEIFLHFENIKGIPQAYRTFSWCGGPYEIGGGVRGRILEKVNPNIGTRKQTCTWKIINWKHQMVTLYIGNYNSNSTDEYFCYEVYGLNVGGEKLCYRLDKTSKELLLYTGSDKEIIIMFKTTKLGPKKFDLEYVFSEPDPCRHGRDPLRLNGEIGSIIFLDDGNKTFKQCKWVIRSNGGKIIHIQFDKSKSNLRNDSWIQLYEQDPERRTIISSKHHNFDDFYSGGQELRITYVRKSNFSSYQIPKTNFRIYYKLINPKNASNSYCGGPYRLTSKSGYVFYELDSVIHYSPSIICSWDIINKKHGFILLNLTSMRANILLNQLKGINSYHTCLSMTDSKRSYRHCFQKKGFEANLFPFDGSLRITYLPSRTRKGFFNLAYTILFQPDECKNGSFPRSVNGIPRCKITIKPRLRIITYVQFQQGFSDNMNCTNNFISIFQNKPERYTSRCRIDDNTLMTSSSGGYISVWFTFPSLKRKIEISYYSEKKDVKEYQHSWCGGPYVLGGYQGIIEQQFDSTNSGHPHLCKWEIKNMRYKRLKIYMNSSSVTIDVKIEFKLSNGHETSIFLPNKKNLKDEILFNGTSKKVEISLLAPTGTAGYFRINYIITNITDAISDCGGPNRRTSISGYIYVKLVVNKTLYRTNCNWEIVNESRGYIYLNLTTMNQNAYYLGLDLFRLCLNMTDSKRSYRHCFAKAFEAHIFPFHGWLRMTYSSSGKTRIKHFNLTYAILTQPDDCESITNPRSVNGNNRCKITIKPKIGYITKVKFQQGYSCNADCANNYISIFQNKPARFTSRCRIDDNTLMTSSSGGYISIWFTFPSLMRKIEISYFSEKKDNVFYHHSWCGGPYVLRGHQGIIEQKFEPTNSGHHHLCKWQIINIKDKVLQIYMNSSSVILDVEIRYRHASGNQLAYFRFNKQNMKDDQLFNGTSKEVEILLLAPGGRAGNFRINYTIVNASDPCIVDGSLIQTQRNGYIRYYNTNKKQYVKQTCKWTIKGSKDYYVHIKIVYSNLDSSNYIILKETEPIKRRLSINSKLGKRRDFYSVGQSLDIAFINNHEERGFTMKFDLVPKDRPVNYSYCGAPYLLSKPLGEVECEVAADTEPNSYKWEIHNLGMIKTQLTKFRYEISSKKRCEDDAVVKLYKDGNNERFTLKLSCNTFEHKKLHIFKNSGNLRIILNVPRNAKVQFRMEYLTHPQSFGMNRGRQ